MLSNHHVLTVYSKRCAVGGGGGVVVETVRCILRGEEKNETNQLYSCEGATMFNCRYFKIVI
jgi:hypothetical protein